MIALAMLLAAQVATSTTEPVCHTPEACEFLDLALSCEVEHDKLARQLAGQVSITRTSSDCPPPTIIVAPATPPPVCECTFGAWWTYAGAAALTAAGSAWICSKVTPDGVVR